MRGEGYGCGRRENVPENRRDKKSGYVERGLSSGWIYVGGHRSRPREFRGGPCQPPTLLLGRKVCVSAIGITTSRASLRKSEKLLIMTKTRAGIGICLQAAGLLPDGCVDAPNPSCV